jgi:hypothetical protein
MKDRVIRWVPVLALSALAGCSGASSTGGGRRDAGSDAASSYGSGSSGAPMAQDDGPGAGSDAGEGGGDDATPPSDATVDGAPVAPVDGSSESAAPEASAASSCIAPEGGAPCDPGLVSCGGASCTTVSEFCCVGGGTGATPDICAAFNGASCPSSALVVACDEAADCSNAVCCEEIVGLGVSGPTQCMTSCPSGWFQVCRSDTECGGGGDGGTNRCIVQTCTQPAGLLTPGSSVTVEACAVPATLGNLGNHGALSGCVAQ